MFTLKLVPSTCKFKFWLLYILISLFFVNTSAIESTQRKCRIKSLVGTVKVRKGESVQWVDARMSMSLRAGDGVRTYVESEVELESTEGSIVKLGENSTLEVSSLTGDSTVQSTKIKILNGTVISNVKKLVSTKSRFDFETPTATAAIRGTIVGFDVTNENTKIRVYEGKVFVTPTGASEGTLVKENQMTSVNKGQKTIEVNKLDDKRVIFGVPETQNPQKDSSVVDSTQSLMNQDSTQQKDSTSQNIIIDSVPEASNSEAVNRFTKSDTIVNQQQSSIVLLSSQNKTTFTEPTKIIPLQLTVNSPEDGVRIFTNETYAVSGTVNPSTAKVLIQGREVLTDASGNFKMSIRAPSKAGELELIISAEYQGQNKTKNKSVLIQSRPLQYSITSPSDELRISKPLVPIQGTVTPGAEVFVSGIKIPVTSTGVINGNLPIPDEENVLQIDIEIVFDGRVEHITKKVIYTPESRFVLQSPIDKQIVTSTTIPIRGEVLPLSSEIIVAGRKIPVSSNGVFNGVITIPDQEGLVELEFEIISNGKTRNEKRTITYSKPVDIYKPLLQGNLPDIAKQKRLAFTVVDRTPDDEITFYKESNGLKEIERGLPNSPFYLDLLEGTYDYTIYAEDKGKNQTMKLSKKVTFIESNKWLIRMRKPVVAEIVTLPPGAPPEMDFAPEFTIEFSIENLPNDNMSYIKEIIIQNTSISDFPINQKYFISKDLSFDIRIKPRQENVVSLTVRDINDRVKQEIVKIIAR